MLSFVCIFTPKHIIYLNIKLITFNCNLNVCVCQTELIQTGRYRCSSDAERRLSAIAFYPAVFKLEVQRPLLLSPIVDIVENIVAKYDAILKISTLNHIKSGHKTHHWRVAKMMKGQTEITKEKMKTRGTFRYTFRSIHAVLYLCVSIQNMRDAYLSNVSYITYLWLC